MDEKIPKKTSETETAAAQSTENTDQPELAEVLTPEEAAISREIKQGVEIFARSEAVLTAELETTAKQFSTWSNSGEFPQGGIVDKALNQSEMIASIKQDLKAYGEVAYRLKELSSLTPNQNLAELSEMVNALNENISLLNSIINKAKDDLENTRSALNGLGGKVKAVLDNHWDRKVEEDFNGLVRLHAYMGNFADVLNKAQFAPVKSDIDNTQNIEEEVGKNGN
jgi:hypothetical protein